MQLPEFESLVQQLLSADNASRKQAEDVYEQLKSHPDGVLELLLRCLRTSPHVQNRQFCAIMLRKVGVLFWGFRDQPQPHSARTVLKSLASLICYKARNGCGMLLRCCTGPDTRRANTVAEGQPTDAGAMDVGQGSI